MDIKSRLLKDLLFLQYCEISYDILDKVFFENPSQVVYVKKQKELYGIITEGDYSRHLSGKHKDLVRTQFTFCSEEELDKAREILIDKNNRIDCIPITDKNTLLYELYVEDKKVTKYEDIENTNRIIKPMDNVKQLLFLLELYKIKKVILLYDENSNCTLEDRYRKLFLNEDFIIQERAWNEISRDLVELNLGETIFIDLEKNQKVLASRQRYLQKFKVRYVCLLSVMLSPFYGDLRSNCINTFNMIRKLYQKIMIMGKFDEEEWQYNRPAENHIFLQSTDQLIWDDKDRCFSYNEEIDVPEVILSFDFFLIQDYIKINGNKVPLFSLQSIYNIGLTYGNSADIDIIHNILPHMLQHNIIPILIADPDMEEPINVQSELRKCIKARGALGQRWENIEHNFKDEIINIMQYENESVPEELFNVVYSMRKGYPAIEDIKGKHLNIVDGIRYTAGSYDGSSSKKVFMFGPCVIMGAYTKDEDTIPSILQSILKDKYRFVNLGMSSSTMNFVIRSNEYSQGDIVILMVNPRPYEHAGFKVYSILDAYNKVPDLWNHIWDMRRHCNKVVNKNIAESLYEIIVHEDDYALGNNNVSNLEETCVFGNADKEKIVNCSFAEIESWRDSLERFDIEESAKVGSIVMNCNPFTLGHRYLIEYASSQVDYLYIFVVEEDRSFFPFSDRIELIKTGTEDIKNVKVLPSGSYIISTATLPGYFDKDNLQEVRLDATLDLELYATQIAPFLKINVRFAGEEPLDKFTCQYNEAMKKILPKYGIEFVEIQRKLSEEEPISASRVRKKLQDRDFESIKKIVPKTTYDYLVKRFQ